MKNEKIDIPKHVVEWSHIADHDPEREAFHSASRELATQERAFFEKLALLDGGIVGLVVSSIFGPLHGQIRHKYTLLLGLTCLIIAMAFLLLRTLYGIKHERGIIQLSYMPEPHIPQDVINNALLRTFYGFVGCMLTMIGISLLVVEVWLLT
jgi:hypothetical protein